ncbi:MAG: hypothetical protein Q9198_009087 [Flavoplaca austrocitrina]
MDLVWEDEEKSTIRLNAYNETQPTRATLVIAPKAYLGWHDELGEKPIGKGFVEKGFADGKGAFLVANDKILDKFKKANAQEVVQRLREMYFEGRPGSLIKLQEAIDGVVEFHNLLAKRLKPPKPKGRTTE